MNGIWEDFIALNSAQDAEFRALSPARAHLATDPRANNWQDLAFEVALEQDTYPLPATKDREGYYGDHHFSYWASGLFDAKQLMDACSTHGVSVGSYLDLGCASGRVIRHFPINWPSVKTYGCDINRLHVEWCNKFLPHQITVFQNSSIPSLPVPDASIDLLSAFSVFTHIEAFDTAWLMEMKRILRPGGLLWVTYHSEHTLREMTESWPLWNAVMKHPAAATKIGPDRSFEGDRLVLRWQSEKSYTSNVFYNSEYVKRVWGKFFEIAEVRRRFPNYQDVLVMRNTI